MSEEQATVPRVYATPEELEVRLGAQRTPVVRERAEALLIDASRIIRAVVFPFDWEEDDPRLEVVSTVCLNMAARAYLNPEGVRQQTLGDLSMTFGSIETGVMITEEERRLLRVAAGFGVALDSIQLTSGAEANETVFALVAGGGDWMPWLSRTVEG
jgi:hypothetical protein